MSHNSLSHGEGVEEDTRLIGSPQRVKGLVFVEGDDRTVGKTLRVVRTVNSSK